MTGTELALPTSGDSSQWNASEKALVEAAGLVNRGKLAPRPVVEAFLLHCQRTGLDPIARQIYCIERGGKWGTQISIDGARLVAERSKQYQGQTPTEWTKDGVTWTQVWLASEPPAAARVGVYRAGFQAPLYAVATFDAYNAGSPIWKKMPALMLGKCAEMLALRKAFPQDLSGLYSSEEMAQADAPAPAPSAPADAPTPAPAEQPPIATPVLTQDWFALAQPCKDRGELREVYAHAQQLGELGLIMPDVELTVNEFLRKIRAQLPEKFEDIVDADVVEDEQPPVEGWPVAQIPGAEGGEQS